MNFVFAAMTAIAIALGIQHARAQEPLRILTEDALRKRAATWFDPKACEQNPGSDLHLSIGKSTLKVPVAIVYGATASKIDRITRDPSHLPQNVGCPERPLPVAKIQLVPGRSAVDALVIVVSGSPDGQTLDRKLEKMRESGFCRRLEADFFYYCEAGDDTRGNVAYLLAVDSELLQKSGGPVRVFCLLGNGKLFFQNDKPSCTVVGDLDGEVRYEFLIAGKPTLAAFTKTHGKARAYVDSLRMKP